MRNTVNLEIELTVLVLLDGTDGTLGFKTLVELTRIEFACNGNILEHAQFSNDGIAKVQGITQELYCWYQFLHIREIAFDEIHELG